MKEWCKQTNKKINKGRIINGTAGRLRFLRSMAKFASGQYVVNMYIQLQLSSVNISKSKLKQASKKNGGGIVKGTSMK